MNITCIDPQQDPLWLKLISRYQSSVFHSPSWIRVLEETYGLKVQAYVLLDSTGEPQAGLTFCRIDDIRGTRLITMPFSDYCDPLVSSLEQWTELINHVAQECYPFVIRCVHNQIPLADERLKLFNQTKWHGLDLQPDPDTLWQGLHSSARRAIRKAQQNGIVVRRASQKEELRAFFNLHLQVRKYKYRLLAQPYNFFEHIWEQFIETQNGVLMLAIDNNDIIGGVMFLEWQDGLYYKFNASAPTTLSGRPNDLLIWEGINYAKAQGYTHLDFGLSDWDQEGLIRYKRKFATEEKTIFFLRYEADKVLSSNEVSATISQPADRQKQIQSLLPQLTELFTDDTVPDAITEKAGAALYRFFV